MSVRSAGTLVADYLSVSFRQAARRPSRTALTILALGLAAALLVGTAGLVGSIQASASRSPTAIFGPSTLVVDELTGTGFDESIWPSVSHLPSVEQAIPVSESIALANGLRVQLVGTGALAPSPIGGMLPHSPSASANRSVAVGRPLARRLGLGAGDTITLSGAAASLPERVGAIPQGDPAGRLYGGYVVLTSLDVAQTIVGKEGRLDQLIVRSRPGADRTVVAGEVAHLLGSRAAVTTVAQLSQLSADPLQGLEQGLITMSALALLVAALVVFNTTSTSVLENRRQFAVLRAIGSPRRVLVSLILIEAAAYAFIGAAVGIGVGALVAHAIVDRLPPVLGTITGTRIVFSLATWAVPAAVIGSVAFAVLGALPTSLQLARLTPSEAFTPGSRPGRPGDRRSLPRASRPRWSRFVASTASAFGASGRLAVDSVSRSPRRLWGSLAVTLLSISTMLAVAETSGDLLASASRSLDPLKGIPVVAQTADASDLPISTGIPVGVEEGIAAVPGVTAVSPGLFSFGLIKGRRVLFEAAGSDSRTALFGLIDPSSRQSLSGNAVIISTQLAAAWHLSEGQAIEMPTDAGPVEARVVAVEPSFLWPGGVIGVGYGTFTRWYGAARPSFLELSVGRHVSAAEVIHRVDLVRSPVPVHGYSGETLFRAALKSVGAIQSLLSAFEWMVVIAACIAVLNTLLMSVHHRERELASLRAIGMSLRTLRGMILVETAGIVVAGGLLGACLGLAEQPGLLRISRSGGYWALYRVTLPPFLVVLAAGILIVAAGVVIPARKAGRIPVGRVVAYE